MNSSLDRLRKLLLPDAKPKKDRYMEEAKRALAEEAKKAYLVRPIKGVQGRKSLERIAAAGAGAASKWAAKQLHEEHMAQENLRRRYRRKDRGGLQAPRRVPRGAARDD